MSAQKVKKKVLFVCTHNSARSQMAEGFLKHLAGDEYEVISAGIETSEVNPLAVESMKQVGVDISNSMPKSVFKEYQAGKTFHYVITLCDEEQADKCPVFPGQTVRLYWNFRDPVTFYGKENEKMEQMVRIRDDIKAGVEAFIKNPPPVEF